MDTGPAEPGEHHVLEGKVMEFPWRTEEKCRCDALFMEKSSHFGWISLNLDMDSEDFGTLSLSLYIMYIYIYNAYVNIFAAPSECHNPF